ncbi:MAG: tRNA (adenosine(37)-N6)-threonylcarbamoyltransferase complex dimerization subunit type 1 TsaB [Planctomycetota bacterium]|jgi:tRNA threonylcarbamoyladenosine biosynthesis protein TsaB
MGDSRTAEPRRLLALETSGKSGSVAVATSRSDGSVAIEQEVLDPAWGSARTLAPAISRLLDRLGLAPPMLQAIAVVQGPGSFTGLRVGAATAKTMAWAIGIPLVAVDALDCVARQVARSVARAKPDAPKTLVVAADAYRGQVFWGEYRWNGIGVATVQPTGIEAIETVARRCTRSQERIMLAGPGAGRVLTWLEDQGSASSHAWIQVLQGPESIPMAEMVAELGWERWELGATEEIMGFLPHYYRGSAAEEKKKGSGSGGSDRR